MIVNELELTKLLVYGTTTPSSDPNTYIRPDAISSAPTPISFSMLDYLTKRSRSIRSNPSRGIDNCTSRYHLHW